MAVLGKLATRVMAGVMAGTIALTIAVVNHLAMPGKSYSETPPPLTQTQRLRQDDLKKMVQKLSGEIGIRDDRSGLDQTLRVIAPLLPQQQDYQAKGVTYQNRSLEIRGQTKPDEIILIGAHYDTVAVSPGADDNASGVAALISLSKQFEQVKFAKTVRFVAFAQEELGLLGSRAYAERSKQLNENIVAMLSFDMLGYYTDQPGSQAYPVPVGNLYPDRGNYLAFISNLKSRDLLRSTIQSFRKSAALPSEALALPELIKDIGRSDHAAFWKAGYPAILVTDTASFRNPHYHQPSDRSETLDFDRLTRAVDGIATIIEDLAG
jgi:Zn-dependent M28 family amino/carboxypeptidase